MGLFDKKYCDICGEKIGLLGNKKLADGNLCKNCENKLSPWFSERKQSTIAEIAAQLEYREANREAVASFKPTRSFGEGKKLLVDEDKMVFAVTSAKNLIDANPDIIPCSDITGCYIDLDESRSEMTYKDSEGKYVSYNPPQYKYSYNWNAVISVNHPYFNEMRFRLNSSSVEIEPNITVRAVPVPPAPPAKPMPHQGKPAMPSASSAVSAAARNMPANGARPGDAPRRPPLPPQGRPAPASPAAPARANIPTVQTVSSTKVDPNTNADYRRYQELAEEIKAFIGGARAESREPVIKLAVNCPFCGASTVPDAAGCCEYCGSSLN